MLEKILEAIEEYNKLRSPEAIATLVSINQNRVIVEITGTCCFSCGLQDWVEDLKFYFLDKGVNVEVENIKVVKEGLIAFFKLRKASLSS
mgnify:CR=1 FL=1